MSSEVPPSRDNRSPAVSAFPSTSFRGYGTVGFMFAVVFMGTLSLLTCNSPSEVARVEGGGGNVLRLWAEAYSATPPQQNATKRARVLYVTRHEGTMIDFEHVAEGLQFDLAMMSPRVYTGYGMSEGDASSIVNSGLTDALCKGFDAVFVGDTIADGWPFYKTSLFCKKVVLLVTNRFDVLLPDQERPKLVSDLTERLNDRSDSLFIVINNPFEEMHMRAAEVKMPEPPPLMRPLGYTRVPEQDINSNPDCVIVSSSDYEKNTLPRMIEQSGVNIHCELLPKMYGGPLTLAKYNAVVHIPYQVSVMKMWENLAANVLTVIPTPEFLKVIIQEATDQNLGNFQFLQMAMNVLQDNWWRYVEFYTEDWSECFPTFSSWEDLSRLLKSPDLHANMGLCQQKIANHREATLQAWRDFFEMKLLLVL